MRKVLGTITVIALISPAAAEAQKDPNFVTSVKDKEASTKGEVEWKASAQAGLVVTTGNTDQTVISAGAKGSRKQGFNKLQLEGAVQYSRTNGVETARAWETKARYDRFLTANNSLYITALLSGDKLAGKDVVAGGQAGYSRQLVKDEKHEVVGEVGYDFSYENFTNPPGGSVSIHSARLFSGYVGKLTTDTGFSTSVEVLMNVNALDINDGAGGTVEASAFEDLRATFKADLTTRLLGDLLSFNFGFVAKYDNFPAFVGGNRAEELDTTTKATLIFNFL